MEFTIMHSKYDIHLVAVMPTILQLSIVVFIFAKFFLHIAFTNHIVFNLDLCFWIIFLEYFKMASSCVCPICHLTIGLRVQLYKERNIIIFLESRWNIAESSIIHLNTWIEPIIKICRHVIITREHAIFC